MRLFDPSAVQALPSKQLLEEQLNRAGWAARIQVKKAGDCYVAAFAPESPACLVIEVDGDGDFSFELWQCDPRTASKLLIANKTYGEIEEAIGDTIPAPTVFPREAARWLADADASRAYRPTPAASDEDYGL